MGTDAWQTGSFVDLLETDTGVPRDCLQAAMDDRVGWRKRDIGGGGGGGGSTEVDLVVVAGRSCRSYLLIHPVTVY